MRKTRAPEHTRGRLKVQRPNRWVTHAAEQCPRCGESLTDGWIQRYVPVAPLEITEHRITRRQCPRCGQRVLAKPVGLELGRIGRCRFGPRLMAAIATTHTVERLPIRVIRERLKREYGLHISQGGIIGLRRMACAGQPVYEQLQADVRASPAVHTDETVWRENGQHTTAWTAGMAQLVYLHHGRRTNLDLTRFGRGFEA